MAFLLLGISTPAFAASSGDLVLSGTVVAACDVTVTPVAGVADNLPLTSAQTALNVGSVNETCNDADGYTVTAQSANNSVLEPLGPTSTDSVPYTFSYGGVTWDLSTGGTVLVTDAFAPTVSSGASSSVEISYSNPGFIEADTYTDTITFTIAAR